MSADRLISVYKLAMPLDWPFGALPPAELERLLRERRMRDVRQAAARAARAIAKKPAGA